MNDVVKLLKSHKSVRKFKAISVEEDKIKEIIECAQSASTSSYIQAYTIIRINNMEKRRSIASLSGNQKYIEECPLFLIFCADLNRLKTACEMNNKIFVEGYTETFILSTVDATLAAQNALIAAESMGLGGVYIGGIRNNPDKISELLKLPTNVYPVFGMCLGYPDEETENKLRLPMEIVLMTDEYTSDDVAQNLKEYDEQIKNYYIKRTNGKRSDTWTNQVGRLMSNPQRPHMKGFLKKQGFEMK
ncbi:oxygen-insensitive NADPH nitroreductase [Clostridium sp. 'White wine YQ']|uniref:oxygen-insensitive NADPH nitroreductase n=1 Tax=Clostridium sp. 'White wine YQ' TaxID=3027474 RepID=UPI0023659B8E|nr:oxygen-insensitive NADPH nitroreductase [Clostridium sp. 'White wine YQ']MDD7794071.1 oxygen-insensitive NADPH nitroreductase [Clostridium sp. 'White wine YQ']